MSVSQNLDTLAKQLTHHPDITLVAVSKYATLHQIQEAYDWGIRHFGENKIQDALAKKAALPKELVEQCTWHLLGHLQKNKVVKTIGNTFQLIHSVDSLALAQKISDLNEKQNARQAILLQVNVIQDPNKTGYTQEALLKEYEALLALPGVAIQGLMTIGPHTHDKRKSKDCFTKLNMLRDRLLHDFGHPLPHLSMGMSEDFSCAMECGATILRVGSLIFGNPPRE